MKKYRQIITAVTVLFSMLFLIYNANESLTFASDAIELCISSLIPSLFPFLFLATLLSSALTGCRIRLLNSIHKLCRIPSGSEILFLLGILGGYPVGAQMISQAYKSGHLKQNDAQRMLGFCNNAGPAFIFGVLGPAFPSGLAPALLWGIQIISAIITGMLLKGTCSDSIAIPRNRQQSVTTALEKSVKTMGLICGWVLLFRVAVGFIGRYTFTVLPVSVAVVLTGILELTNGCVALSAIESSGMRFVLSAFLLSAGGLCVALQTASAVKPLKLKTYLTGKCIQTIISTALTFSIQPMLFQSGDHIPLSRSWVMIAAVLTFASIILIYYKKTVAFRDKLVYN